MELFEQLRREYEFGIGTIKGVARKFGVHRRLVRQAVNSALPPVRTYRQRPRPVLGAVEGFIDGILGLTGRLRASSDIRRVGFIAASWRRCRATRSRNRRSAITFATANGHLGC